jgi:hypothetical protein
MVTARVVLERPYGAQLLRHAQSVSDGEVGYLILDISGTRSHIISAIVRALPHVEVLSPADLIRDVRQQIEAVALAHSGAS